MSKPSGPDGTTAAGHTRRCRASRRRTAAGHTRGFRDGGDPRGQLCSPDPASPAAAQDPDGSGAPPLRRSAQPAAARAVPARRATPRSPLSASGAAGGSR